MLFDATKESKLTNKQLQMIVSNLQGGIIIFEVTETVKTLYINELAYEMCGYSKKEYEVITKENPFKLVYPEDKARVIRETKEALKSGVSTQITFRMVNKDGKIWWNKSLINKIGEYDTDNVILVFMVDISKEKELEEKLKISEQRFVIAFEQTSIKICEYDIEKKTLTTFGSHTDKTPKSKVVENMPLEAIKSKEIHPNSEKNYLELYEKIICGSKNASAIIQIKQDDGNYDWVKLTYKTIFDTNGKPVRAIGVFENRSVEKAAEIKLKQEQQYRDSFKIDAIIDVEVNISKDKIIKQDIEEFAMLKLRMDASYMEFILAMLRCIHESDREQFLAVFNHENLISAYNNGQYSIAFKYRLFRESQNRYLWVLARMQLIVNTINGHVYGNFYVKDIDEKMKMELLLHQKAEQDSLTHLYNRESIESQITEKLHKQSMVGLQSALFMIDIDNFKMINDTFGHEVGDKILCAMAGKLKTLFRQSDVIGRMGGDEFIIFMSDLNSVEYATTKGEQLCRELNMNLDVDGRSCKVTSSIGIAIAPLHGKTYKELYVNADSAAYVAKRSGKNSYNVFGEAGKVVERGHI